MATKQGFYVVWKGKKPGIYKSWKDCELQVKEYPGPLFKKFETLESAEKAFSEGHKGYWGTGSTDAKQVKSTTQPQSIGSPMADSISVDAACNGATGDMEYQGVRTTTKQLLFKEGPFKDGTNNTGEFLAIVHGLAYLKKRGSELPVYSDSRIAIGWVKAKKAKTKQVRTEKNKKLFELIERAEKWLETNSYTNKVLKWETGAWGENPADFGRK